MKLNELLDKKYAWKYESAKSGRHYTGLFKTEDKSVVRVYITFDPVGAKTTVAIVTFSRDMSQGMTGTGDAYRIFSTVVDIVRDVIDKEKPDVVAYAADKEDRSRVSLYDKMTERYKPAGYKKLDGIKNIADESLRHDLETWIDENHDPEYALTLLIRT